MFSRNISLVVFCFWQPLAVAIPHFFIFVMQNHALGLQGILVQQVLVYLKNDSCVANVLFLQERFILHNSFQKICHVSSAVKVCHLSSFCGVGVQTFINSNMCSECGLHLINKCLDTEGSCRISHIIYSRTGLFAAAACMSANILRLWTKVWSLSPPVTSHTVRSACLIRDERNLGHSNISWTSRSHTKTEKHVGVAFTQRTRSEPCFTQLQSCLLVIRRCCPVKTDGQCSLSLSRGQSVLCCTESQVPRCYRAT